MCNMQLLHTCYYTHATTHMLLHTFHYKHATTHMLLHTCYYTHAPTHMHMHAAHTTHTQVCNTFDKHLHARTSLQHTLLDLMPCTSCPRVKAALASQRIATQHSRLTTQRQPSSTNAEHPLRESGMSGIPSADPLLHRNRTGAGDGEMVSARWTRGAGTAGREDGKQAQTGGRRSALIASL